MKPSILLTALLAVSTVSPLCAQDQEIQHELKMLARPKGDRVHLRWAPDSYVTWRYLCGYGYNLIRIAYDDHGSFEIDTLATEIKPMRRSEMEKHFQPNDTLAGAACTLVYGKATAEEIDEKNGMAAIMKMHDEQESRYSFAMLLADLRFDLAEAMGLAYVDKHVKKGAHYEYILHSAMPDSIFSVRSYAVDVINEPYQLPPYQPVVADTVTDAVSISLHWPYDHYTAYDVEYRPSGSQDWIRANERPYMMLSSLFDPGTEANSYNVSGLEPGSYEFRLRAYDAFGDVTSYSSPHVAKLPDLAAPSAPMLKSFRIDRTQNPKVFADIYWEKPILEDDFVGYNVLYFHKTLGDEWRQLNKELISPRDTTYRCEVSGLASGYVMVHAVDTAGNIGPSVPYELHIADLEPPIKPTGITHSFSPEGIVELRWKPNPEPDVRYYQLYAANAVDHVFIPVKGSLTNDTIAHDTLDVIGLNQRFIYYRLVAFDYSGNRSEMSDIYQVERLNYSAPEACRLDSIWQEEKHIYTRWFKAQNADVKHYRVFRRLSSAKEWQLIQMINPDSIQGNFLVIDDEAEYVLDKSYLYAIETVNFTGISSGMSQPGHIKHWGPAIRDIAVNLKAKYLTDKKVVELTWTVPNNCPDDYYFVLSTDKGNETVEVDEFQRIESIASGDNTFHCYWLRPGATARFYMEIYWRDRSRGVPSNVVSITNPYAKIPDETQK